MSQSTSNAPVFVVGHGRSGTTLLRLMLNEHSNLAIPPESSLVSYLRRADRKGSLTDPAARTKVLERMFGHVWMDQGWIAERGLDRDTLWKLASEAPPTPGGIMDALMSHWAEQHGATRWGEKVPNNYRFLPEIAEWFPGVKIVHLIRDGRDVALSCLTPPFADKFDHGSVYEVALRWQDAVRKGHACRAALGNEQYFELHYEELVTEPEPILRHLCTFLGEEFEPGMLEYHKDFDKTVPTYTRHHHQNLKKAANTSRVGRWRRDASEEFVVGFEGIAGPELAQCGYELSNFRRSPGQRTRIAFERFRPRRSINHHYQSTGHRIKKRIARLARKQND